MKHGFIKQRALFTPLLWVIMIVALSSFLERLAPEKFTVDTSYSTLVWRGKKVTGNHTGTIKLSSGELLLDESNIRQGNFEIDLSSITATDVTDPASNKKLVDHLKSDDFFRVAKFPKAAFVITSVQKKTAESFAVKGRLTINGITNEIEFPASIKRIGKKLTAVATIAVDRTKYDIKFRSTNFFENLDDTAIDNNFELTLNLIANQSTGV